MYSCNTIYFTNTSYYYETLKIFILIKIPEPIFNTGFNKKKLIANYFILTFAITLLFYPMESYQICT